MKNILKGSAVLLITVVLISGAATAIVTQSDSTKVNVKKENTVNWVSSAKENLPVIDLDVQPTPVPLPPTDWLHFDDGTNTNALGLTAGGTFEYGIRLTPDELTGYDGCELTTVRHHHGWEGSTAPSVSGNIKIYDEGDATSPGTLLHTQSYTTLDVPGWEDYTLTTPITIDETKDLWICLEVTHQAGEYPAGMDPGPAVDGKGDWIYLDPGPWEEVQDLGFDINWNLWAGLECETTCDPSIDVEKQVWCATTERWVDADTRDTAHDVVICTNIQFRIIVKNTGNCPLYNVRVLDKMHNSLKYLGADPVPDEEYFEDPFYFMIWYIPSLVPGQDIVIYVNAHVEGPECSYDVNHAEATGECEHGTTVFDEDDCWIHAKEKAREFNSPILNFLENHPNMFPLLQLVLQRLGLY